MVVLCADIPARIFRIHGRAPRLSEEARLLMAKWLKWTLIILLILAVVTVAVLALGMYIPYHQSENYMPEKAAWVMTQKPDGAIH